MSFQRNHRNADVFVSSDFCCLKQNHQHPNKTQRRNKRMCVCSKKTFRCSVRLRLLRWPEWNGSAHSSQAMKRWWCGTEWVGGHFNRLLNQSLTEVTYISQDWNKVQFSFYNICEGNQTCYLLWESTHNKTEIQFSALGSNTVVWRSVWICIIVTENTRAKCVNGNNLAK